MDIFLILLFGDTFAGILDQLTAKGGTGEFPSRPYNSTEEGPTSRTTTTLTDRMTFSATGSAVTGTMTWTYKSTTTDKATGAVLHDLVDDQTLVLAIDVCPNAAGAVPASLNKHRNVVSTTTGGSVTTLVSTATETFTGQVSDSATLSGIREEFHDESSTTTVAADGTTSAGGYNATFTNVAWGAGESGASGGFDAAGVQGDVSTNGDATADAASRETGWALAVDKAILDPAWKAAQKLWRNGRCVVVAVPEYGAETPVEVAAQDRTQHDEEVDVGSMTKFALKIRQRFDSSALNQPTQADLIDGDKKLEPSRVDGGSGSLTYTAPDEEDKKATAKMRSTSKRGIGTLVIAFHTQGKHLRITIQGTVRTQSPGAPFAIVSNTTIGPADFTKRDASSYESKPPVKSQIYYDPNFIPLCEFVASESGTLDLTATVEKRGDSSVWVIRADRNGTNVDVTASACIFTASASFAGGGYAINLVAVPGDIVVPIDGGTVPIQGTQTLGAGVTSTVQGTLVATVTRD